MNYIYLRHPKHGDIPKHQLDELRTKLKGMTVLNSVVFKDIATYAHEQVKLKQLLNILQKGDTIYTYNLLTFAAGANDNRSSNLLHLLGLFVDLAEKEVTVTFVDPKMTWHIAVLKTLLDFHTAITKEAIELGRRRAKKEGRVFGRNKIILDVEEARKLLKTHKKFSVVARIMKCSVPTLQARLRGE